MKGGKTSKASTREPAGDEIRRGVYGAIGAGLVAAAGLLIVSFLSPNHPTPATSTTTAAGGCGCGCGGSSAAKVYG